MSITDQFWQYAKEAMLLACDAKTDDDRQGLLELARTWTHAALVERQSINRASPFLGLRRVAHIANDVNDPERGFAVAGSE